jgi:hypothetical protein
VHFEPDHNTFRVAPRGRMYSLAVCSLGVYCPSGPIAIARGIERSGLTGPTRIPPPHFRDPAIRAAALSGRVCP